jgi:hypothetical protein
LELEHFLEKTFTEDSTSPRVVASFDVHLPRANLSRFITENIEQY